MGKRSQDFIDKLKADVEVFKGDDGKDYALCMIPSKNTQELFLIESKSFREYLEFRYYDEYGALPSHDEVRELLTVFKIMAMYAKTRKLALRVAAENGRYFVDLCNDQRQVIEIMTDGTGYKFVDDCPFVFKRLSTMEALPVPKEGGSIDELWKYAPVDKKYRDLIIVFILDVLKADTEYCLLEIVGEQGSAKSFLQDLIKQLTDPKVTNLGRPPSGERNFFVAAANSHLISIENVSSITQNDSDNYCTVITGGGTVERKLYSNSEEAATNVRRPIVINGINSVVDREDLRDRTMLIQMSRIEAYKSKSKLMADFNERKAYIFHDMLKLMSEALQLLPEVEDSIDASELPRLADLGCFGEAVYRALEEKPGKFLEHFRMVQIDGIYSTLESSTVAVAAKRYVEEEKSFEGLVGELREKLEDYAEDINSFPKTSHAFGRELRRCVPALRKVGINIVVGSRNRYGFPVTLRVT